MARSLDLPGQGHIERSVLRDFMLANGVSLRDLQRWIKQAKQLRLIRDNKKRGWYFLTNLGLAAAAVGADDVGVPSTIPLAKLLSRRWKAHLWGAYLSRFPRVISQARLETLSGIAPRSQREYNKQAGVIIRKNFLLVRPGDLRGIDGEPDQIFTWKDVGNKKNPKMLARRLPNTHVSAYQRGRNGRSKKAKAVLKLAKVVFMTQPRIRRLYYDSPSPKTKSAIYAAGAIAYKLRQVMPRINTWGLV